MANWLFYKNLTALDTRVHRNLRIAFPGGDFSFAARLHAVPLATGEFVEASKELPIVFVQTDAQRLTPVAVVGLRQNENLLVGADGRWAGRYVPAFLRRYPFLLAQAGEKEPLTVCVDQDYAGFNAPDGQLLIDEQGNAQPPLQESIKFLEQCHAQFKHAETLAGHLQQLGLLKELSAQVSMNNGETFGLNGFFGVDEEQVAKLEDAKVLELFRSGALAAIYSHVHSLTNLNRLIDRMAERNRPAGAVH